MGMKKTVIFGASVGGIKLGETFQSLDISFDGFVDNDAAKCGKDLLGKKIISPKYLGDDYNIIIASEHQLEIEKQLEKMGIIQNLQLREQLIRPKIDELLTQLQEYFHKREQFPKTGYCSDKRKIIIDLMEGMQLGGIETWVNCITKELKNKNVLVKVYAKKTDMLPISEIEDCFEYYKLEYISYRENVIELASALLNELPCTVIINKHTQLLWAAYLVKKLRPKDIRVVSVIHNDMITLYRRQKEIDDITDKIICVSKRIKDTLIEKYDIKHEKVFYKESPIYIEVKKKKKYTLDRKEPIHIGYAARLTKFQKRADLLIELIENLEKYHCNYNFEIAGDGPYKDRIEEYVEKRQIKSHVQLLGRISHNEIADFWHRQDLFISVSDFEGVGISMLEAMAQGVAVIETNVAGAEEFVLQDQNGYIVQIGNMQEMTQAILKMEQARERLPEMGKLSTKIIREKCDPSEYAEYIRRVCFE